MSSATGVETRSLRTGKAGAVLAVLLVGVGVRLIGISQPFVDAWSWRQADVAMIAENFYRHGFRVLYPQINWAGSAPGYIGTEFPLVPFLASILYVFFGVSDWIGRALSVLFFACSVAFLYALAARVFNPRSGVLAAAFWSVTPLSIFAGRSFMPDMASVALSLGALYLFLEWLTRPTSLKLFLLTGITTSLAILVKLPAIIIGVPLFWMAWKVHSGRLFGRRELWALACLALIPSLLWYLHAWSISRFYFPYHFFGEGGLGLMRAGDYLPIARNTATFALTPVLVPAVAVAFALRQQSKFGRLFHWWLIAGVVFVVFAAHGNRHSWYRLPLVPPAAALAGMVWDRVLERFGRRFGARAALVFGCMLFLAGMVYLSYKAIRPHYDPWAIPLWKAGQAVDRIAAPDALIIAVDKGDPTILYYSRRKGWHFSASGLSTGNPSDSEEAITTLENLRKAGATYLVFTSYTSWWLEY